MHIRLLPAAVLILYSTVPTHIVPAQNDTNPLANTQASSSKINENEGALHKAVKTQNATAVKHMIAQHYNLEQRDENNRTPFHVAAMIGDKDLMVLLYKAGARINTQDDDGNTPLHDAVERHTCKTLSGIIGLLTGKTNSRGTRPHAERPVNTQNNQGETPLHVALLNTKTGYTLQLLNAGARYDIIDNSGLAPLHIAAQHPDAVLEKMLDHPSTPRQNTNVVGLGGKTILHYIVSNPNTTPDKNVTTRITQARLNPNAADQQGFTPLHTAALEGKIHLIKAFIRYGGNLNVRANDGSTPLEIVLTKDCANATTLATLFAHGAHMEHPCFAGPHGNELKRRVKGRLGEPFYHALTTERLSGQDIAESSHTLETFVAGPLSKDEVETLMLHFMHRNKNAALENIKQALYAQTTSTQQTSQPAKDDYYEFLEALTHPDIEEVDSEDNGSKETLNTSKDHMNDHEYRAYLHDVILGYEAYTTALESLQRHLAYQDIPALQTFQARNVYQLIATLMTRSTPEQKGTQPPAGGFLTFCKKHGQAGIWQHHGATMLRLAKLGSGPLQTRNTQGATSTSCAKQNRTATKRLKRTTRNKQKTKAQQPHNTAPTLPDDIVKEISTYLLPSDFCHTQQGPSAPQAELPTGENTSHQHT